MPNSDQQVPAMTVSVVEFLEDLQDEPGTKEVSIDVVVVVAELSVTFDDDSQATVTRVYSSDERQSLMVGVLSKALHDALESHAPRH